MRFSKKSYIPQFFYSSYSSSPSPSYEKKVIEKYLAAGNQYDPITLKTIVGYIENRNLAAIIQHWIKEQAEHHSNLNTQNDNLLISR